MKTLLLLFISIPLFSISSKAQTDSTLTTIPNYVKSGFGATLTAGFGLGVENKEIFETEDGDESTLSAGGGLFIGTGLYYITEKNIKFGSTFYYQASELRPPLENASSSFKRLVITPEIKFPIELVINRNLNIGGGYGFYLNGKMNIDATEIAGFSTNTEYENTGGLHLLFEYEEHYERGFLTAGIKYYNVEYEYKSGAPIFESLNGSGFDFYFSYTLRI